MGFSVRGAVRAEDVGHLRLWPHLRLFVERADDGAEIFPAHVTEVSERAVVFNDRWPRRSWT